MKKLSLTTQTLIGLFGGKSPKFAKRFVDVRDLMSKGIKQFCEEVRSRKFPDQAHSYTFPEEELKKMQL